MKKKKSASIILNIFLGTLLIGTGVFAKTVLDGASVSYDNETSGLSSTNVQSALDELNEVADTGKRVWNQIATDTELNTRGYSSVNSIDALKHSIEEEKKKSYDEGAASIETNIIQNPNEYGFVKLSRLVTNSRSGNTSFNLSEYNMTDTDPSHYIVVVTSNGYATTVHYDETTWYRGYVSGVLPTVSISGNVLTVSGAVNTATAACNGSSTASTAVSWALYYIGDKYSPIGSYSGNQTIALSSLDLTDTDLSHYFAVLTSTGATNTLKYDSTTWYRATATSANPTISISNGNLVVTNCYTSVTASCNGSSTSTGNVSWKLYHFDPTVW